MKYRSYISSGQKRKTRENMLALALAELRFMSVSSQLRSHSIFTADICIIALFKSDKKFLDEKLFRSCVVETKLLKSFI